MTETTNGEHEVMTRQLQLQHQIAIAETMRKKMHTPHPVRKVVAVPVAAVLVLLA